MGLLRRVPAPRPRRLLFAGAALAALAGCTAAPTPGDPPPAAASGALSVHGAWPPQVGQPYPDLELLDGAGRALRLSEFSGKVLLIEPVGMTCPACNAFAGAGRAGVGGFRGVSPQAGLPAIEDVVASYASGVELSDPRLAFLVLLLYDSEMQAPDAEDARAWERHFGATAPNAHVLVPAGDLRGTAAFGLIPGFQLVDRDRVLRFDSAGHRPTHDLWRELLPALPRLLQS